MRGKVQPLTVRFNITGITPAYAGKSLTVSVLWIHDKDHPRLCGEKKRLFWLLEHDQGSPPPMRGKVNFMDPVCV